MGSPTASAEPSGEAADVIVGRVARPFGRRGEVVVEALTDDPARFLEIPAVETGLSGRAGVHRAIASVRLLKGRPVLRFEGVSDISGAETLRAHELRIRPSERALPPDGQFYLDDLVGCTAEARDGRRLGEIVGLEDTAGPSLLVLRGEGGGEDLIPFVEALCVEVDLPASRLVLDLPDGLLGLNAR